MKLKILIIDDDTVLCDLFKEGLNHFLPEVEVIITESAKQAIQYLENNRGNKKVNLVISDIYMPEMNGIELILYIKINFPEIEKFYAMSGNFQDSDIKKLRDLGVDKIINKPFGLIDITRLINPNYIYALNPHP